jgi:membrane protein required for colicin V production
MIILDIGILVFLAFWSVRGFMKGFSAEILSLIVWVIAIYATLNYFHIPVNYIQSFVSSPMISMIITYALIFIFTFISSAISGYIASKFVNIIGYYSFDKSLGFVFGTIKGFSFTVLITFFILNTELASLKMVTDSQFIPHFEDFLNNYLISSDSLFDSLQLKI